MNKGVLAGLGPGDGPDVASSDAGQNAVLMSPARKEVPFSASATGNYAVTDVSNFRFVSFHFVAGGASVTINAQSSNDGINWVTCNLQNVNSGGNYPQSGTLTTSNAGQIYGCVLAFRYFRLNVSAISGTVTGVLEFFSTHINSPMQLVVPQSGGGSNITVYATNNGPSSDAAASSSSLLQAMAFVYNGSTYDRPRTPNTFKTVTATASGDTAVWTPTTSKKFRLMRYQIQITGDVALASAADLDIVLRDSTTAIGVGYSLYVPAASVAALGSDNSGWVDLGNGYLSSAINQVLNVNLSATLTSGKVRVVVAGTEE